LRLTTPSRVAKSKKQRRLAAKKQRQQMAKLMASGDVESLAPKIPLEHQTINLPDGRDGALEDVLDAEQKRLELKKAMRAERKRKIKENNFLRSM
jgi:large subunit ribosomal protein L54